MNTIFNDQLYSRSEGLVTKIMLVLAQPMSPAPPGFADILLDAAKFAFDSEMILESGIWGMLKGWVRILWSLTYDNKSAWSYYLSAGLPSYLSFSIITNIFTLGTLYVLFKNILGINYRLDIVSKQNSIVLLFRGMIPKLLGNVSIKLTGTTCICSYSVQRFVNLIFLK